MWPTSIGAARNPAPEHGETAPGVPSSPQHFRDERLAGARSLPQNPKSTLKTELSFCQHSLCAALVVHRLKLLVCKASHENHYSPCETPVHNEAAMPFLEQDKPPGC